MSRKDAVTIPPKLVKTPTKSSHSDESDCPKSPHVTKRARVRERPPEEVEKAQKTWDRNMGIDSSATDRSIKEESRALNDDDDDAFVVLDSYV